MRRLSLAKPACSDDLNHSIDPVRRRLGEAGISLGFIVLLLVLLLEKSFRISASPKLFAWFFWTYNIGLIVTAAMLVWHGSLTVLGEESSAMISGIAGLGHILLSVGMVLLFLALGRAIARGEKANGADAAATASLAV